MICPQGTKESNSEMVQMFKFLVKDIQSTEIKMEKVETMKKEMGNCSQRMEIIKEKQTEGRAIQLNNYLLDQLRSMKKNKFLFTSTYFYSVFFLILHRSEVLTYIAFLLAKELLLTFLARPTGIKFPPFWFF